MLRILRRIHFWFRATPLEAELNEELELHRAMTQERLERSGTPLPEAAHASRRVLGNVTLAREDAHRVWIGPWLESVAQDVAYAVRTIRRAPGFAASMILVLALGIGATACVFALIDGLVLRSLPVHEPDRLVYLGRPAFSYPIFTELRSRSAHIFSDLVAWNLEREPVQWHTELEPSEVLTASGRFYSTLGVSAVIGRTFTAEDDEIGGGANGLVAVISYACWQQRFGGSSAVVGRSIRIRRQPFTIVGVTPAGFFGVAPGLAPEITIPLMAFQEDRTQRGETNTRLHLLGRLRDGLTLAQANAAFQTVWPAVLEATTGPGPADRRAIYLGRTSSLEPARNGFSRVRNQFAEPLWVLLGLVALLLTVAMASAANLLLARGATRRREFTVRLAIGAGRSRVVRQVLTEALVWTILGAVGGLLIAIWGGQTLVAMMRTWEEPIALDAGPNWRVGLFTFALSLLTAALCAIAPALRATRLDGSSTLKEFGQVRGGSGRRWSMGKSLVAAQVALTVLLLFGAGLFVRSLRIILRQDAGFDREAILVVSTDPAAAGYAGARHTAFYGALLDRLRSARGVQSASLSWYPPISDEDGHRTPSVGVDGAPPQRDPTGVVYFNAVSPGYFHTMGIRLLHGRDFADADRDNSRRVVIVNDSLARRFFPSQSALGRTITIGLNESRRNLEIVGVVADAKYQYLTEPARSIAFLPSAQLREFLGGANLVAEVRVTDQIARAADVIRSEIRSLDATVPLRIETVSDRIRASLVKERVIAMLAAVLGSTALALACAGLYGLLAYTVARRTSEIGLRLALGADRGRMLWMVLRQSLALAAVGIAGGIAASLAFGKFARNLLFQVSETDPVALAAAAAVMLCVAACAGFLPARRAARVDPLVALRSE